MTDQQLQALAGMVIATRYELITTNKLLCKVAEGLVPLIAGDNQRSAFLHAVEQFEARSVNAKADLQRWCDELGIKFTDERGNPARPS